MSLLFLHPHHPVVGVLGGVRRGLGGWKGEPGVRETFESRWKQEESEKVEEPKSQRGSLEDPRRYLEELRSCCSP